MGSKATNAQTGMDSFRAGFDKATGYNLEADARKRQEAENANEAQKAQQVTGQEPSSYDTLKSMYNDLTGQETASPQSQGAAAKLQQASTGAQSPLPPTVSGDGQIVPEDEAQKIKMGMGRVK